MLSSQQLIIFCLVQPLWLLPSFSTLLCFALSQLSFSKYFLVFLSPFDLQEAFGIQHVLSFKMSPFINLLSLHQNDNHTFTFTSLAWFANCCSIIQSPNSVICFKNTFFSPNSHHSFSFLFLLLFFFFFFAGITLDVTLHHKFVYFIWPP